MEAVVCENLVKTFTAREKSGFLRGSRKTVKAVDGVSLKIRRGEVFGLVGPNGAGKTTTIKILSTLLIPDSGDAWVNGFNVLSEADRVRESLGLVLSPDKGFYSRLTGIENLAYYGRLYGLDKSSAVKRAKELVELVGLGDDGLRMYDEYSLGMKAKLSIAKSLIHDPPILFLDEPTIGLDPLSARKIRQMIDNLVKQGKTILLTSHNMWEVESLSAEVAVINKGRIAALGTPNELKQKLGLVYLLEVEVLGNGEFDSGWRVEAGERGHPVIHVESRRPSEDLPEILEKIRRQGLQIGFVRVHEPSMEEVFARVVAG
ncbi:MAG: ATP-binding cassette domain-containing protein [Candidatus Caldarchaeum sp.]|nr:ATP-binding cassette domain-containing protein [Candidatus Caldarchaeum sp.]MDW7977449.1 ATP-binding cassette domain-containing protein [Candidatus Caldarchaeum sp.]